MVETLQKMNQSFQSHRRVHQGGVRKSSLNPESDNSGNTNANFLKSVKGTVERALMRGALKKPLPATAIDPEDYAFIRELKQRGESNGRVAEILHVTEDALRAVLDKLNLE